VTAGTAERIEAVSQEGPEPAEPTDEVIMTGVLEGDGQGIGLLFRRYARLVRVVAMRILRDEAEADDLVQELFLFIHNQAAIYDGSKSTLRSWIVQMTFRRAISRRRYLAARGHYRSIELNNCVGRLGFLSPPLYDASIEALFGKEGLKRVMKELTTEQRETLRLYFYEGYTLAEISQEIGQSVGNVRHHYYRGLEKLRRQVPESKLPTR
jgi:RNA polymerase sigma-70 factor, ECF subfamily